MVMVVRLSLMESNLFSKIVLLLCSLTFISCNGVQTKEVNNEKIASKQQDVKHIQESAFLPDSTVNGILVLSRSESVISFHYNISSEKYITHLRESPVIGFSNKNNSEYLLLYQYEGGVKNGFSCFEIGYTSDLEREFTALNYDKFKTESGLMLGMTLKELENVKGGSYTQYENKVVYQLTDYPNSSFLRSHNMPAYFLECTMRNDRIIRIKYGFDYP
jgi:hypothetical protein